MPRNVTVTFADGSQHVYQDAPDNVTPDQITERAMKEFGKKISALDGGRGGEAAEPDGLAVTVTDTGEGPYDPTGLSVEDLAELESDGFKLNDASGMYERAPVETAQGPTPSDDSALHGLGLGAGKVVDNLTLAAMQIPGIETAFNAAADFTGTVRPRDAIEQNDASRADNSRTGWQTVGTIVPTLATLALPGGGLAQGAVAGALSTDARDAGGVAFDATLGGLVGKGGDMVAGVIAPQVSPMVRKLLDEGVRLTPGQIAGQGGLIGRGVKQAEDILGSIPIVGGSVRAAQERGVQDLNTAAINRALRPIGDKLPRDLPSGNDAVAYAGNKLRDAYADVLPRLSGTLDNTFQTRVSAIDARVDLPAEYASKLDAVRGDLRNAFQRAGPNGAYSGRTLRDASERLEDVASAYRKSDDPYLRRVGDVAEQYRQQLHSLARRQNPEASKRLRDIDRGYASLVRVEKAAGGTADGAFSPAQYQSATRMTDRSARRRASARGQALDQDLASAANIVMTNRAAQGGSKDVNSVMGLLAGAGAAATGNPVALAGAGLIGAGTIGYSRPAQALARGVMARNPSAAEDALSQIVRYGNRAVSPSAATSISALHD